MNSELNQNYDIETLKKAVERAENSVGKSPAILQYPTHILKTDEILPPKISVISVTLNNAPYLRDTIHSILNQSYDRFELIVVDGGSTDKTVSILKEYPQIRWISEKDSGTLEAIQKGLAMSRGEYISFCCVTDGYLDKDWLKKCAEKLDTDPEVSLVWGLPQHLLENGTLDDISYKQFHRVLPPQKENFIYYWLLKKFYFPEGNLCVRKITFEQYIGKDLKSRDNYWFEMNYRFNIGGYLPFFIPTIANFGRKHLRLIGSRREDSVLLLDDMEYKNYIKKARDYQKKIEKGQITHRFVGPMNNLLPYSFSLDKYKIKKHAYNSDLFKTSVKKMLPARIKKFIQKYITKSIQ